MKWVQRAFFACAALLLGYSGFVVVDSWAFQRRESMDLDRLLGDRRVASSQGASAVSADGLIGRIEIPSLGLSAVVVEGVGRTALRRGVGHIPGTALPGEDGNVGLSAHRDTFFRPLKDLRIKDEIHFATLKGDFRYEVESLKVVAPGDVQVLAASHENALTLVTCYPFFYVGAAPKRFIVRARQVSPETLARASVK
ncbi:MAG TPA: class D sortase [Bryobacteraceae bacterium]|nr:class D sortase [Bryobacteraceae bacterium]